MYILCEDSKWHIVKNNEAMGNQYLYSFILDLEVLLYYLFVNTLKIDVVRHTFTLESLFCVNFFLMVFNIKMSWKVYHKLAHTDKQEGGACLYVAVLTSPIAVSGPTGHRVVMCEQMCMSIYIACILKRETMADVF